MYQNFEDAVAKVFEAYNFFCQATKSFVPSQLSFVGSSYFANMTWRFSLHENFRVLLVRTRLQKRKIGNDKKNYAIFLQTPNSIFCCVAGCKENWCYSLKMASLGSMYYPKVILPSLKKNVMSRIDYNSNAIWFPQKTSIAHQAS